MVGSGSTGYLMCRCTPNKRTPFCGKPGCEPPPRSVVTNVLTYKSTAERLAEMRASPYVAPDTDPA
jgi:hypothetical protein